MQTARMKQINPLVFLPGTMFWAAVIAGVLTKNDTLIGFAVVLAVGTIVTLLVAKGRASGAATSERKRIWQEGTQAKARIVSIGTRGGGMNDNPLIDFELEVLMDGVAPYRVSTQALISKLAIPRIQPECEIIVRVAADNSSLVVDEALTPYGYK